MRLQRIEMFKHGHLVMINLNNQEHRLNKFHYVGI